MKKIIILITILTKSVFASENKELNSNDIYLYRVGHFLIDQFLPQTKKSTQTEEDLPNWEQKLEALTGPENFNLYKVYKVEDIVNLFKTIISRVPDAYRGLVRLYEKEKISGNELFENLKQFAHKNEDIALYLEGSFNNNEFSLRYYKEIKNYTEKQILEEAQIKQNKSNSHPIAIILAKELLTSEEGIALKARQILYKTGELEFFEMGFERKEFDILGEYFMNSTFLKTLIKDTEKENICISFVCNYLSANSNKENWLNIELENLGNEWNIQKITEKNAWKSFILAAVKDTQFFNFLTLLDLKCYEYYEYKGEKNKIHGFYKEIELEKEDIRDQLWNLQLSYNQEDFNELSNILSRKQRVLKIPSSTWESLINIGIYPHRIVVGAGITEKNSTTTIVRQTYLMTNDFSIDNDELIQPTLVSDLRKFKKTFLYKSLENKVKEVLFDHILDLNDEEAFLEKNFRSYCNVLEKGGTFHFKSTVSGTLNPSEITIKNFNNFFLKYLEINEKKTGLSLEPSYGHGLFAGKSYHLCGIKKDQYYNNYN